MRGLISYVRRSAVTRLGVAGSLALVVTTLAGCGGNPASGTWTIGQRQKELEATYLDELTTNIRKSTGATQIEFQKDSIVISGGAQPHTETGVIYSVDELPGGAVDIRILQPRAGDTTKDVDILHIDKTGNSAQLETPTELVDLTRAGS